MLHNAWNSKEEVPYCFPRSSIKFQGHTGQNITDFDPNWAFPDYRPVAAFKSLRFALFYYKRHKSWVICYLIHVDCLVFFGNVINLNSPPGETGTEIAASIMHFTFDEVNHSILATQFVFLCFVVYILVYFTHILWGFFTGTGANLYHISSARRQLHIIGVNITQKSTKEIMTQPLKNKTDKHTLIARFMGPTWGPSGADRTQVGPMLAPWTLLSG